VVAALAELDTIDPLEDRLRERLEFLKKNRDDYVATAQRQLAALDAAIGELSALLNPASPNGREDGADGTQGA
jgi:hypothetical protein